MSEPVAIAAAPAAPPADAQAPASAPAKTWRAGTLVYGSGALAALFCYLLLGDFAWSMRERSVMPMAQWYLNHLHVPNIVFALLFVSFPALVGLVLGPIISVRSDHHRGRWGRRIPFLLVTTPIGAAGMLGLAATPWLSTRLHALFPGASELAVAITCFGVFWAVFEFATIAGTAVLGGLVNDVVPKEFLGRFYGLFRAVSLLGGMVFNFWIFGHVPAHFPAIMSAIAVFYCVGFMWTCLKVKEGGYPPPPPRPASAPGALRGFWAATRTYCRECFAQPYYLAVFLMLTAANLAFLPINTFSIPYAASLGVDMAAYGRLLALTYLISLGLSYFLGWLADRFHPLRVSIAMLAGYVLVAAWGAQNARTADSFLLAWVLHGVLSGCYFTSSASLAQRLFPHHKFAQFASAAGVVMGPATMAVSPLVGIVIDRAGDQYDHAFTIGAALGVIALAVMWEVHRRFMRLGGPSGYVPPE